MTEPASRAPSLSSAAVIVIFHDRTEYLRDALASIRAQSGVDEPEVVVVGPKDPGPKVLAGTPFVPSGFQGIGGKVADGLRATRAPIVTFLEDDDRFLPDHLRTVLDQFSRTEHLGYLQTAVTPIGPTGEVGPLAYPHRAATARWRRRGAFDLRPRPDRRELRRLVGIPAGFNNSSIAVRRALLAPRATDLEAADLHVDLFLLYVALSSGHSLRFDPTPLTELRVHPGSTSDPSGLAADEEMSRLRGFLERTEPGRQALAAFARRAGPPTVARAAEGQVAVEHLIHRLRSPDSSRADCARDWLETLARIDTFEVLNRHGALWLGAAALVAPRRASALYFRTRQLADRWAIRTN